MTPRERSGLLKKYVPGIETGQIELNKSNLSIVPEIASLINFPAR